MTDYTELIEALRCKRDDCEGCDLAFFDKDEGWMCQYAAKDDDAAAAIEELQTVLKEADKKQAYQHDRICELTAENEELKADVKQLEPKRGEMVEVVRCKDCKHRPTGTGVNHDIEFPDAICPCQCYEDYWYSWMPSDDWYCGNGEKMEVQE